MTTSKSTSLFDDEKVKAEIEEANAAAEKKESEAKAKKSPSELAEAAKEKASAKGKVTTKTDSTAPAKKKPSAKKAPAKKAAAKKPAAKKEKAETAKASQEPATVSALGFEFTARARMTQTRLDAKTKANAFRVAAVSNDTLEGVELVKEAVKIGNRWKVDTTGWDEAHGKSMARLVRKDMAEGKLKAAAKKHGKKKH